nr:glutamyl-tRNA reductase (EC 1.2.1.-) - barley [Hordeum vulgare]
DAGGDAQAASKAASITALQK